MISVKRLLQFAAISLVAASGAQAQDACATPTPGVACVVLTAAYAPPSMTAVTAFGYYMSPYSGTVNGTVQRLNCVDFFHDVNVGNQWSANIVNLGLAGANPPTSLGLLSTTRDGSSPNLASFGNSPSTVLDIYEQMAYLTDQMPDNPGGDPLTQTVDQRMASMERTMAIQTAIWAIGDPGYETDRPDVWNGGANDYMGTFDPTSGDNTTTGYWIGLARSQYNQQAADYYYQFNVITNVDLAATSGSQEFIYKEPFEGVLETASPEPGTLVLMGSGLIGMLGVVSRRRKKSSDPVD